MSYSSPSTGPGGHAYSYDDYEIPAYEEQGQSRHQMPSRPLPSQQQQQHHPDPRMRFPRPQANPRPQPARQVEPARNMYDGSDYGYDEEPEQDQWPLSSQPAPALRKQPSTQFQRQHPSGARSGPPPRPQRPDYVPSNFEPPRQPTRAASANQSYQQPPPQQRQPRSASAGQQQQQQQQQQYQKPYQQSQSHHGSGQWTGNGYSYAAPSNLSQGYPVAQQASYSKNTPPRPPLGPPPSARRGPSSYYSQQLSPVHPIAEEAERASLTREQSRTSLASSNAIPIGIPKFYLDGRESGISITPSSTYSEHAPGVDYSSPPRRSEILRPLKQRMQKQEPEPEQNRNALPSQRSKAASKQQPEDVFGYFPPVNPSTAPAQPGDSPSNAPLRQASLGKRSKPKLTHVKSGERARKSSIASKAADEELQEKQHIRNAEAGAPMESPVAPPPPAHTSHSNNQNASFFDSSSEEMKSPRPSATLDSPRASIRVVNSKEHLGVPRPTPQAQTSPRNGGSPLAYNEKDDKNYDALSKEMLSDPEKGELPRQDSDTLRAPMAGFSDQRGDRRRPPRLNVDATRDEEARGSLTSLSDLIKRATRLASNLDRGKTASRLGMDGWLGASNGNSSNSELEKYYRTRSAGSLSDILASFPPPGVPTPTGNSLQNWSSRRGSAPLPSDCGSESKTRHKRQRRCCGVPLWLFVTLLLLLLALIAAAVVIPMILVVMPNMKDNDSKSSASAQADTAGSQAYTLSKCSTELTCENGGQAFSTSDASGEDTCRCLCIDSFTGPNCSSKSTAGCTSITIPGMKDDATIGSAIPRLLTLAETDYDLALDTHALLGLFNEADLSCAAENALVSFDGKSQKMKRTAVAEEEPSSTLAVHRAEATTNGIVYDSRPSPSESESSAGTSSSSTSSSSADVDVDFARAAVLYVLQTSSSLEDAESVQKALQGSLNKGGVVAVGEWKIDLGAKTVQGGK